VKPNQSGEDIKVVGIVSDVHFPGHEHEVMAGWGRLK
jgi:hypothetical protein